MGKFRVASIASRVRDEIWALRLGERELAINALRDVLYEGSFVNAVGEPENPEACVRCGLVHIRRKGYGRDGSQRWLCVDCGRTFNARTSRVVASSKLKPAMWFRFIECFVDCLSLRKCAARRSSWTRRTSVSRSRATTPAPRRSGCRGNPITVAHQRASVACRRSKSA